MPFLDQPANQISRSIFMRLPIDSIILSALSMESGKKRTVNGNKANDFNGSTLDAIIGKCGSIFYPDMSPDVLTYHRVRRLSVFVRLSLLEGLRISYCGPNNPPQLAYFDVCVRSKKMVHELRLETGEEKYKRHRTGKSGGKSQVRTRS
jgi:hypothetical protein